MVKRNAKNKRGKKTVTAVTVFSENEHRNSIITDANKDKQLIVKYTHAKSKKGQLQKEDSKSSSEEDPDYDAVEFAILRKEINEKYGITQEEYEQKKEKITTYYTEFSEVSVDSSKDGKSCQTLRRCFKIICCCCYKKNSKVAPMEEGMNHVEDRVDVNDLERNFPSGSNINKHLAKGNMLQNSSSLPSSLLRVKTKKKVKFVGIVASVNINKEINPVQITKTPRNQ